MRDWTAVLTEHGPRVWRTVFRVLSNWADAHDCYQETFLAAWELEGSEPIRDWKSVLVCLATRKAIDRLRKRIKESARIHTLDSVPEPSFNGEGSLQGILANELLANIRNMLTALPEKQAHVVWLSCVEELTHSEIADQLKISTGEVRVLLHRGRTRLQEQLVKPLSVEDKS